MKPMDYQAFPAFAILSHGTYQGFPYWVTSLGTHPTAYIDVTSVKDKIGKDARIMCHGGITYDEDRLQNVWDEAFEGFVKGEKRFIGWDYAHAGDYVESPLGSSLLREGRKHTAEEIVSEVKEVIDDLVIQL